MWGGSKGRCVRTLHASDIRRESGRRLSGFFSYLLSGFHSGRDPPPPRKSHHRVLWDVRQPHQAASTITYASSDAFSLTLFCLPSHSLASFLFLLEYCLPLRPLISVSSSTAVLLSLFFSSLFFSLSVFRAISMRTNSRLHASHSHEHAEWSVALQSPGSACLWGLRKGTRRKRMEVFFFCATVKMSERLLSHFIVSKLF